MDRFDNNMQDQIKELYNATNEDCIHTIAGSRNVAELEGSYQVNTCEDCGYRNFDRIAGLNIHRDADSVFGELMKLIDRCRRKRLPLT